MADLLPVLRIPTGTVTPYVIVVGDPERAQDVAERLDDTRELARFREYWSYAGSWQGIPLTVTSHGVGGAGAAVAFEELIRGGARTIVRLGTAGALVPGIHSGDLIVATAAVREDGVSDKLLPESFPAVCDVDVTVALTDAATAHPEVAFERGVVISTATFYPGALPAKTDIWDAAHVIGIEMELATLLVVAALRGARAGGVFTVDGNPHEDEASIYDYNPHRPVVDQGKRRMIEVGLDAIARLAAGDRERAGGGAAA